MNSDYIKRQRRKPPSQQNDLMYFGFLKPERALNLITRETHLIQCRIAIRQYEFNAQYLKLRLIP